MNPSSSIPGTAGGDPGSGGHLTGLLALVFTDVVGSTQMKETLGDREGVALIQQHHALIRSTLTEFPESQEINTAGDSFFIAFGKPSDAVHFALLVQSRLRKLKGSTKVELQDRVGIHLGEVVIESGGDGAGYKDLHGIHIDTCARVMSLANAGQILMTRSVFDSARQALKGLTAKGINGLTWGNHGPYVLKGIEEPIEICEVSEIETGAISAPATSEKARRFVSEDSEEVLGWRPAVEQVVPGTKWMLERKLGEGGFGEVWLGRHHTMKERRVFKFCFRADRVRSLKREMTLFRILKDRVGEHLNIVSLREVYFDEPPFYIEMDYADGLDLKSWCEQQSGVGNVALENRLEIVAQIADALSAAHGAGVIHRDIKPGNILVGTARSGVEAKLTDFGIGQVVSQEALAGMTGMGFTQTMLSTGSASQSGTQLYMAPELLAGHPASSGSDIYSLGVVLYQLVVGDLSRPLTTDWARNVADPFLREDLGRCFAGDPGERFRDATLLASNLRSLTTRHAELAERRALAARRRTRIVSAIAAVVILVPALIFGANKWLDVRRGGAVLTHFGEAYGKAKSIHIESTIRQELLIKGVSQNVEFTSSYTYVRPNKLNLTIVLPSQQIQVVSDGKRLWSSYSIGEIRQHKEREAPPTLDGAIEREFEEDPLVRGASYLMNLCRLVLKENLATDLRSMSGKVELLGSEEVDGKPTFKVQWTETERMPDFYSEGDRTLTNEFVTTTTVWVRKSNGHFARVTRDATAPVRQLFSVQSFGGAPDMMAGITKVAFIETPLNLKLDEGIPDARFAFSPSAGSVKVDKFSVWLKAQRLPDKPAAPRSPSDLAKLIPARSPSAKPEQVDLSAYYNESLKGFQTEGDDNNLDAMPRGVHRLAGVDFDIRAAIELSSRTTKFRVAHPKRVAGIQIGRKVAKFHLLHGSHSGNAEPGAVVASYVLNFANGEKKELPVRYGVDIVDWWRLKDPPPGPTVAWTGTNKSAKERGATIQLFKSTYTNSLPDLVIESVDFVSSMETPAPFVIAMTIE